MLIKFYEMRPGVRCLLNLFSFYPDDLLPRKKDYMVNLSSCALRHAQTKYTAPTG